MMLKATLSKRISQTEYDQKVASGEIVFLDCGSEIVPVSVGPVVIDGKTAWTPTGPLMQVSGEKDAKNKIEKAKIVKGCRK